MGSNWKLGNVEAGYTIGEQTGNKLKVYIPKITPLMGLPDKPEETTFPLTGSCFINDDKCKPSVSSSVTVRNYIEVPLSTTAKDIQSLSNSVSKLTGGDSKEFNPSKGIPHKTKVSIEIQNNDVAYMKIKNLYN